MPQQSLLVIMMREHHQPHPLIRTPQACLRALRPRSEELPANCPFGFIVRHGGRDPDLVERTIADVRLIDVRLIDVRLIDVRLIDEARTAEWEERLGDAQRQLRCETAAVRRASAIATPSVS